MLSWSSWSSWSSQTCRPGTEILPVKTILANERSCHPGKFRKKCRPSHPGTVILEAIAHIRCAKNDIIKDLSLINFLQDMTVELK